MRILELRLDAFGPFTEKHLDLSGGHLGLHLIYGPNEAGKTSALRALRQLFYGIPGQTSDDFIHPYRNMRLGAKLARSDSTELEFVRLKRNKNPLCRADGTTPLDPSELDRFLCGVDENLFRSLFGIDHDVLVEGGQEIANGGGLLGNALFAASSGISNLRAIQQQIQAEADELFKPGGRVQKIPRAMGELREAQGQSRSHQLPHDLWSRHEQALREAEAAKLRLEEARRTTEREASRLGRIRKALPLYARRAHLLVDLEAYRHAILLPPDFAEHRREVQERLAIASREAELARHENATLAARLEQIEVPGALLSAEKDIEDLRNRRAQLVKALDDRPQMAGFLQDNEHAAREILQTLGQPRDLAAAESLRLRADEPPLISKLAHQFTELTTSSNNVRDSIARNTANIEDLRRKVESLGILPELGPLRAALREASREGDLEARREGALRQLEPAERAVKLSLRRLQGWTGSAEELEELPIPLPETVTRFEKDTREAESLVRDLDGEHAKERKAVRSFEARIREQALQHEVPTEEDLSRARSNRDRGWALVRGAWLNGEDESPSAGEFVAAIAPGRSLADAFERSIVESDSLADRLRREAERVARKAEWLTQLRQHGDELDRLDRSLGEAKVRLEQTSREWDGLLAQLGLSRLSPAEFRAWTSHRDRIVDLLVKAREHRAEVQQIDRQIGERRSRLATCLRELTGQCLIPEASLLEALDMGNVLLTESEDRFRSLERLSGEFHRESHRLESDRLRLEEIESQIVLWRSRWGECMARIGLGPDAMPEQAEVFLSEINRLFQHLEKAKGFRSRIKGMDRDAERFTSVVAARVAELAPELAAMPPEGAVDGLELRLREARQADQERRSIVERMATEATKLSAAEQACAMARDRIEVLCREAGCSTADELPEAERRSGQRSRLESELEDCDSLIRDLSAGASVTAFQAEVESSDPDALERALAELAEKAQGIQDELDGVNQRIGSEKTELAKMDGSSKAAEASVTAAFAAAQLLEDVPHYAVLRLASRVLQQGIERYRERNQGPVVARASDLFRTLTLGSFEGLRIEANDRGDNIILGVRPGGRQTLEVNAMSDGTCDQLYLAIRIAYLENWLASHEPIPFIVDDILLQFDDNRAMATLHVLGELSNLTQVIFFTHHAHILELARSCLGPDVLFPQDLGSGTRLRV